MPRRWKLRGGLLLRDTWWNWKEGGLRRLRRRFRSSAKRWWQGRGRGIARTSSRRSENFKYVTPVAEWSKGHAVLEFEGRFKVVSCVMKDLKDPEEKEHD